MQERLKQKGSLEIQRRLRDFLDKHSREIPAPERLREIRMIELLQRAGTKGAKEVLQRLVESQLARHP